MTHNTEITVEQVNPREFAVVVNGSVRCYFAAGFGSVETARRMAEDEAKRVRRMIDFDRTYAA